MTPAGVDATVPNVARIYDYLLGGKDNFEVDRKAAEALLAAAPEAAVTARANRAFLGRAVRALAAGGVRQFLDVGAGLPTRANVHEVARRVAPDARTVYVDHDPVVVAHGRALLSEAPGVAVVHGDLYRPEEIRADPVVQRLIDPAEPVAVLMLAVLHFVPDAADPAGLVRRLTGGLAPGSALVLSHATSARTREDAVATAKSVYTSAASSIELRSPAEIARLFGAFEPTEPGVVYAPEWRPDDGEAVVQDSFLIAGVGLLPGA
ncbi:SAM-dependent methyltransferase [Actinomadura parmotrematis]|uniref:SAM-dependent methyltransferase n=1 Tax=Actinomadura parmotrematis TaxID=2864039 RepID=A0ABS7FYD2_9ACTN|nr:SAM-dependent methyltransferase [Actinomadura parmotrematis]MBW8485448.1 SAM-dependent methyltransferase [Actinomadura parmotrematis]